MRKTCLLFLFTAAALFGQLDDNTITITANRQVTLQPDEIVFYVTVQAAETLGIDDVLAKLAGTGITTANLTSVFSDGNNTIDWAFTLGVPLSQVSATSAALAQLQQKSGISFSVQGAQVSKVLQQSQTCSQTSLIADAQTQAQALATAAGFTVGPVLAVSDGSGEQKPASVVFAAVGDFLFGTPAVATQPTCTAVVKFQLYAYH